MVEPFISPTPQFYQLLLLSSFVGLSSSLQSLKVRRPSRVESLGHFFSRWDHLVLGFKISLLTTLLDLFLRPHTIASSVPKPDTFSGMQPLHLWELWFFSWSGQKPWNHSWFLSFISHIQFIRKSWSHTLWNIFRMQLLLIIISAITPIWPTTTSHLDYYSSRQSRILLLSLIQYRLFSINTSPQMRSFQKKLKSEIVIILTYNLPWLSISCSIKVRVLNKA